MVGGVGTAVTEVGAAVGADEFLVFEVETEKTEAEEEFVGLGVGEGIGVADVVFDEASVYVVD